MRRLKEFRIPDYIRGVMVEKVVCADTKKSALNILDTTAYQLDNFGTVIDPPRLKEPFENHHFPYVMIDPNGELMEYDRSLGNKVVTLKDFEQFMNEYRKRYPTHRSIYKQKGRL